MANDSVSYSWFAIFNNPHEHGYPFENSQNPADLRKRDENSFKSQVRTLLEKLRDEWITINDISLSDSSDTTNNNEERTGAWAYCISDKGLHHVHMVLCNSRAMRWSKVKKVYCQGMNFSSTKGTKKEADDYINKRGKFAEKGETIVDIIYHGEICSNQGHRSDLDCIQELLDEGKHPDEIISMSIRYARLEKCIKTYYIAKKSREVPIKRDVSVHWLFGGTGTGKSNEYLKLCNKYGEDEVFRVTNYTYDHLFDNYFGQKVVFFDEFRGNIHYNSLLNLIDVYKIDDLPARYRKKTSCYSEVYFSTPLLPHEVYNEIYEHKNNLYDGIEQLMRRINDISYFYKNQGKYYKQTIEVKGTEVHNRNEFFCIPDERYLNSNDNDDDDVTNLIGNLEDYAPIVSS